MFSQCFNFLTISASLRPALHRYCFSEKLHRVRVGCSYVADKKTRRAPEVNDATTFQFQQTTHKGKFFGFFRFVCFRKTFKTSCISMKTDDNQEMNIVDFERHKLIAFSITVGSIP